MDKRPEEALSERKYPMTTNNMKKTLNFFGNHKVKIKAIMK